MTFQRYVIQSVEIFLYAAFIGKEKNLYFKYIDINKSNLPYSFNTWIFDQSRESEEKLAMTIT